MSECKSSGQLPLGALSQRLTTLGPERLIWPVLLLPWLGWCTVALLSYRNLSLDMVEMVVWGRQWQFAYWKHPPLPACVAAAVEWLSAGYLWTQFIIGPTIALITMWMVWRLARELMSAWHSLCGVMILGGCIFYGAESIRFNHNVIQWPIWAGIAWAALRALRGSRGAWLVFGLLAALGMYAKYSTAVLLLSIGLFAVIDPQARRVWRSSGPYLALGAFALGLLPHLKALHDFNYSIFQGLHQGVPKAVYWYSHLTNPADFLLNQLGAIAGALVLFMLFALKPGEPSLAPQPEVNTSERRFLLAIGLGPLLITVAANVVMGSAFSPNWGSVFYVFLGLLLLACIPRVCGWHGMRTLLVAWVVVMLSSILVIGLYYPLHPYIGSAPSRVLFSGERMATRIAQHWHELAGPAPIPFAIGDAWCAGNLAAYSPDHPALFIDGSAELSPWINITDFARRGGVGVWQTKSEESARRLPGWTSSITSVRPDFSPEVGDILVFPLGWQTKAAVDPAWIGCLIVPPQRRE